MSRKIFGSNLDFVREDDYVEYFIFPKLAEIDVESSASLSSYDHYDESIFYQELINVKEQCMNFVRTCIEKFQYIWHKDEFNLNVRTCSREENLLNTDELSTLNSLDESRRNQHQSYNLPPHLHGVTHYGENITDEWFVVYLLIQLTLYLPNCVVRVIDADGEFPLIEAAHKLPKWANPDTCEQRVYITNGSFHLIQNSPSHTTVLMPVDSAIKKLRANALLYKVSHKIQNCFEKRLHEFQLPTNMALHNQIVLLHPKVIMLLKKKPYLVAPAVRAMCEADTIDLKFCRTMRYFPPDQRMRTNVYFTRCLYAMLMHNNYMPERKTGWNLNGKPNSEAYKEDLLGIKLTCGFEILVSKSLASDNSQAWKTYLRSLHGNGYFRQNIEGTLEFERLMNRARKFFNENEARFRTAPLVGKEILQLLQSIEEQNIEHQIEEMDLTPSASDDWLNIDAERLDSILLKHFRPEKFNKSKKNMNAKEFTENVADFLNKQSFYEGVENDSSGSEEGAMALNRGSKEMFLPKAERNRSEHRSCHQYIQESSQIEDTSEESENGNTDVFDTYDLTPVEDWDSKSEMSAYSDEDGIDFASTSNKKHEKYNDIKDYIDQMDRELAGTTIGQTFALKKPKQANNSEIDEFDDIENFEPIDINVNTLRNMLDSYKFQLGGPGPASNLFNVMGIGMSAAIDENSDDIPESTV